MAPGDRIDRRSFLPRISDAWTATVKSMLPQWIRLRLSRARSFLLGIRSETAADLGSAGQVPWCSPNVWHDILRFYRNRHRPVVFEFGCGVSTLHHIRALLPCGGTYIGVESDPVWYARVVAAVLAESIGRGNRVELVGREGGSPASSVGDLDRRILIKGPADSICTVDLRLRPEDREGATAAGAAGAWAPYVEALREPCDVLIIDGKARKACVNRALDRNLIKPGGLLVLFEAGRGLKHWFGRPTLTGEDDYQSEVQRIMRLGARMVDGCGVDRWPELSRRRTPGREAHRNPAEACFLVLPGASDLVSSAAQTPGSSTALRGQRS